MPRLIQTRSRLNTAAKAYIIAVHQNRHGSFDPEALGSEFTLEQIELRALEPKSDLFADWELEQDSYRNRMASILGAEHQD